VLAASGSFTASLSINPSQVREGQSINLQTNANGGTLPYTYSYTGLPSGCSSQDSSGFSCTPSSTGNYNVQVSVTDAHGNQTTSNPAGVDVTSSNNGNGGSSNNSSNPFSGFLSGLGGFLSLVLIFGIVGFITWILLVVGIWVIAIVLYRRLPRRGEASPAAPSMTCAGCGASIPVASKFCPQCGRPTAPKS
jgi:hypothetical protein